MSEPVKYPPMQTLTGKKLRAKRVGEALASAIRYIEEKGYSVSQAAEATGYKAQSLHNALGKPHVKAFRADVKRAWRESESPKAWNRIVKLSENAGSEKVKLDANKTILTALGDLASDEGGAPSSVALIQIIRNETHHHGHSLSQRLPGVVQSEPYQEGEYEALDPQPGLTGQDDS